LKSFSVKINGLLRLFSVDAPDIETASKIVKQEHGIPLGGYIIREVSPEALIILDSSEESLAGNPRQGCIAWTKPSEDRHGGGEDPQRLPHLRRETQP